MRRHRFGVAVAAAAIALLLGFAVAMTILAGRIADERDRANQQAETTDRIAQFLKELFMVSDPSQARGETVTAREILDQGARKLDDTLKISRASRRTWRRRLARSIAR